MGCRAVGPCHVRCGVVALRVAACSRAGGAWRWPNAAKRAVRDAQRPRATRGPLDGRDRPPVRISNVILITIDCLRADMPWAGYARPIAPRLTELEKRAVSYTRAYSLSSYTSMSLGGLLGGKLPGELKRDGFFFGTYPPGDLFFPELLQAAHVHTLGAEAHAYFKDPTFQQGFDRWTVVPDITFKNTTDENVTSPKQEALAEKLLSEKACDGRGSSRGSTSWTRTISTNRTSLRSRLGEGARPCATATTARSPSRTSTWGCCSTSSRRAPGADAPPSS